MTYIDNTDVTIRLDTRDLAHKATENAIDLTTGDAVASVAYEAIRVVVARSANATENAVNAVTAAARHPLAT